MNRKEITRHKKKKSNKLRLLFWGMFFAFVAVLVLFLFTLGGKGIGEILNMRDYWLSVGVASGLILIGYLMMYRVDAQNIALNENDLEDTEWTVFTPSYELKKVYFPEGKAAIGKREAVLFEKENYVFDITGDIGQKIEDKISELIEEQEAEEAKADENDKAKRIAEADVVWDKVAAEINAEVDRICAYLDGRDTKALKQAAWENKAGLLLTITEHYEMSVANKMRLAADRIQLKLLPKMKQIQEQAKR